MKPAKAHDGLHGLQELQARPLLIALAGPNGTGKTTFYESYLRNTGLRFLNADVFARELEINAYDAAQVVTSLRREFVNQGENFIFETVFSDPVGDKLAFLKEAARRGYTVVLYFIGIQNAEVSEQRVAIRVKQGGHDVPTAKLFSRFPRTMANLKQAIRELPCVVVLDNDNLEFPFDPVALFRNGNEAFLKKPMPSWLDF